MEGKDGMRFILSTADEKYGHLLLETEQTTNLTFFLSILSSYSSFLPMLIPKNNNNTQASTGQTLQSRSLDPLDEIPLVGFVNGIAVGPDGRFCVVAVGQEPRMGRWDRIPKAKNRFGIVQLQDRDQTMAEDEIEEEAPPQEDDEENSDDGSDDDDGKEESDSS